MVGAAAMVAMTCEQVAEVASLDDVTAVAADAPVETCSENARIVPQYTCS